MMFRSMIIRLVGVTCALCLTAGCFGAPSALRHGTPSSLGSSRDYVGYDQHARTRQLDGVTARQNSSYQTMRQYDSRLAYGGREYPSPAAPSATVGAESSYVRTRPVPAIPAVPEDREATLTRPLPDTPGQDRWWASSDATSARPHTASNTPSADRNGRPNHLVNPEEDPYSAMPEYLIQPGDTLEITLASESNQVMSVQVRPDGRINYRYGIEVIAAGRTYRQLHDVLMKELSRFYKTPRLTVIGRTFSGNSAFVMTAKGRSGKYGIKANTRLLDLLSQIGLLSAVQLLPENVAYNDGNYDSRKTTRDLLYNRIDWDGSYIARQGKVLNVDFKKLLIGRDLSQNIFIRPSDFLFFPSVFTAEGGGKRVYLTGDVSEQRIVYWNGEKTIRELLIEDGEMNMSTARIKGIYIVRKGLEDPIRVNAWDIFKGRHPDITLENNDIVWVPERALSKYGNDINTVISEVMRPFDAVLQLHAKAYEVYGKDWQLKERGKARTPGNSKNDLSRSIYNSQQEESFSSEVGD